METLGIKTTFSASGVEFQIQKDTNGSLYMVLSGGGLSSPLALPYNTADGQKLMRLIALAAQLTQVI